MGTLLFYYNLQVIIVLPAADKIFMPARDTGFDSNQFMMKLPLRGPLLSVPDHF